jgi:hypothetical protein
MRLKVGAFEFNRFTDEELVLRFISVFSRFEYALKRDGWLQRVNAAKPNWDGLARHLEGHFDKTAEGNDHAQGLREAADYILNQPPQEQVVDSGHLEWRDKRNRRPDLESLLLYVRRMRNNLFHGGKSQNGSPMEVDRNARLLGYGLTVLEECLHISKKHRHSFVEHFEEF